MLEQIRDYIYLGNHFCGIEHTALDGKEILYASLLVKKRKEVLIDKSFETAQLTELKELLPKKQHAFLIINNEQVITKKIETESSDDIKLVHNAFPNINPDEFVYEVLRQDHFHFVSICRKQYLTELIEDYKTNGISIVNVSLGNLNINAVSTFIDLNEILTSNALITKENHEINKIELSNDGSLLDYDVNGLKVNSSFLLSLSGALSNIIKFNNDSTNFESHKQELLSNYKQSQFTSGFIKTSLVFILLVLLINFFFFNHYFNGVNDLQVTAEINLSAKSKTMELNTIVDKKKKRVDDMFLGGSSKSSFYADEITSSISQSVILLSLNFQPLLKRIKDDKEIIYDNKVILISGESANSVLFSNWISTLEAKTWIKNVEIIEYGNVSNSKSNFSIKLLLNDK